MYESFPLFHFICVFGTFDNRTSSKYTECIEGRNLLFHNMELVVYSPKVMWGREALQTAMERFSISPLLHIPHSYIPSIVMGKQVSVCIIIIDIFLTTGSWYNLFQSRLNKPGSLNLTFYLVTVLFFQLHSPLFTSTSLPYSVISFLYCLTYVCSYRHWYKHTLIWTLLFIWIAFHTAFKLGLSMSKAMITYFHPFMIGKIQYIWHLRV